MRFSLNRCLTWCTLLFPWIMLAAYLQFFWTYSPQYEYGWLVIPLGLRLFYLRWNSLTDMKESTQIGAREVAILCALLIAPLWLIRQTTTHWGVPGYGLTALVTVFTLAILGQLGGWRLARQMAIPILFIFCAVKLPLTPEQWIIQSLSRFVTTASVEVLYLLGITATGSGNLVILSNGVIGINEACSGINSLQSLFMVALFFGEERRMRILFRVLLVALGVALSLLLNVVRVLVLSLYCVRNGMTDFEIWHDRAGWSILLISLGIMMFVAKEIGGSPPKEIKGPPRVLRQIPTWLVGSFAIWFIMVVVGTEVWFRSHDHLSPNALHVEIRWPKDKQNFASVEIPNRIRDITLCSDGHAAKWQETDDVEWNLSMLEFGSGPKSTAQWAPMHTPDICFPAAGMPLLQTFQPVTLPVKGGEMVFRSWEFRRRGGSIFVFHSLHNEGNVDPSAPFVQDLLGWNRAIQGQRNLGQQTVEFSVTGLTDYNRALQSLKANLPRVVTLKK